MGTHTGLEHFIPARDRRGPESLLFPILGAVAEILVATPHVVDQDVQSPVIGTNTSKYGFDLRVVAKITLQCNTLTALLCHFISSLLDCPRQSGSAFALFHGS